MGRMGVGRVVDLVKDPAAGVVLLLADVEPQAARVVFHGFTGVVQERLLELLEQLPLDRNQH